DLRMICRLFVRFSLHNFSSPLGVKATSTSSCYRLRENTSQRLSAAARRAQLPQGLIPTIEVARLMTSPRPISSSLTNPGNRARYGLLSGGSLAEVFFFLLSTTSSHSLPPTLYRQPLHSLTVEPQWSVWYRCVL